MHEHTHRTKPPHLLDTPTRQVQDLGIKDQTLTSAWQPLYLSLAFFYCNRKLHQFLQQMLRGRGAETYIEKNRVDGLRNQAPVTGLQGDLECAQYSVGGRMLYIDSSAFIRHPFLTHTHTPNSSQQHCYSQPQDAYPNSCSQAVCCVLIPRLSQAAISIFFFSFVRALSIYFTLIPTSASS